MKRSSLLVLAMAGCTELDDPTTLTTDDVFNSVVLSADSTIADGLSKVIVTVELEGIPTGNQSVSFSADRGRFLEAATATPRDVSQKASGTTVFATYVSDTIAGEAAIQVGFGDFRVMNLLRLTPVLPDQILLNATASQATVGNGITVQVRLLPKQSSAVSRGQFVHLDVQDSTGLSLHEFSTVLTYRGEATLNHSVSARASGPVTVTARMKAGAAEITGGPLRLRFIAAPPSSGQ